MDAFVKRSKRKALDGNCSLANRENKQSKVIPDAKSDQVQEHTCGSSTDEGVCGCTVLNSWKSDKALIWKHIRAEKLDCDYSVFLSKDRADSLLKLCEEQLTYNTGRMAQVQIFGKWLDIPRKQVAFGDEGLSYTFSNNEVPARPWLPFLESVRDAISDVSGHRFNFVLINRYENGNDHMGEHRDDEKDLVKTSPIASLSLGQERDFIFKHADARGKNAKRQIPTVKLNLEHGSLLLMKYPTNIHWYHALPKRKRALGVRINMTFRDFVVKTN